MGLFGFKLILSIFLSIDTTELLERAKKKGEIYLKRERKIEKIMSKIFKGHLILRINLTKS